MNLRSVLPPMPTPFRDGEVDPAEIHAAGLGGVVALGSNGESAPLAPVTPDTLERIRTLLHDTAD